MGHRDDELDEAGTLRLTQEDSRWRMLPPRGCRSRGLSAQGHMESQNLNDWLFLGKAEWRLENVYLPGRLQRGMGEEGQMTWTQEVSLLRAHSLGMEDAYIIKNAQNSDNCKHLHLICWVTKRILLKHFVFRYHFRLIDESEGESYSIMSDSLWPYRLWPTRLLCPWNSPGKNTGAGSHSLLQGIFPTQGLNLCLLHWQPDSLAPCHLLYKLNFFSFTQHNIENMFLYHQIHFYNYISAI